MLKKLFLTTIIFFCAFSIIAQENEREIFYKRNNLEISLSFNQNFTFSSGRAINFWAFYDYKESDYWQYDQYYPLLQFLNADTSEWRIEPSPSLNINYFHFIGKSDIGIGINTSITRTNVSAIATSIANGATARLYVKGYEYRTVFSPALGYKFNKLYTFVNLNITNGFKKKYDTYLEVSESNNQTTRFENDHDLFYKNDFTLGLGFGFLYKINPSLGFGLKYNNHKVNISEYRGTDLIAFPNAYWNHSLSLSLGYSI